MSAGAHRPHGPGPRPCAPARARTWPAEAAEGPEALEAGRVVRAGSRRALQHLLLAARALVARVRAVAPEPGAGSEARPARTEHYGTRGPPASTAFPPRAAPSHASVRSPVDQVVAPAPVRARLALALVQVQLAARAPVARRAHAAVGAHAVQARAPVQAGPRGTLVHLRLAGHPWTGPKTQTDGWTPRGRSKEAQAGRPETSSRQLQGVET